MNTGANKGSGYFMNDADYDPNWRRRFYQDFLEPFFADIGFPIVVVVVVVLLFFALRWLTSLF